MHRVVCTPSLLGSMGYKNTPPSQRLQVSLFTHASCGRCGSSTFMQTPAAPYKLLAEPHALEKAVSPPRSLPPVKSFHAFFYTSFQSDSCFVSSLFVIPQ